MQGPLAGVRVLDLTRFQNGPSATRRLADYGADVLKVEAPVGGDGGRSINVMGDGFPLFFETFNRGKRSITIDLKHEGARDLMHGLVKWADVLAENFKPGTLEKWGYGYAALKAINPRLIYASNSGYGPAGRFSELGCYDLGTQAFCGAMATQGGGPSHPPRAVDWAMADEVGAMNFAFAISTALYARTQTGEGQLLETSQLGAMLAFMGNGNSLSRTLVNGREKDDGKAPFVDAAWRQSYYHDKDNRWFVIAIVQEKDWRGLCAAVKCPELLADLRYSSASLRQQHTVALKQELQLIFGANSSLSSAHYWRLAASAVQIVA